MVTTAVTLHFTVTMTTTRVHIRLWCRVFSFSFFYDNLYNFMTILMACSFNAGTEFSFIQPEPQELCSGRHRDHVCWVREPRDVECKWPPGTANSVPLLSDFLHGPATAEPVHEFAVYTSMFVSLRRLTGSGRTRKILTPFMQLTDRTPFVLRPVLPVKARSQRADKNRIISERLFFVMWWQELTFYNGYNFFTEGLQDAY